MAGFARVAFEGEYKNQQIVNVFHYRSEAWLPGQGNPFDDTLAFVDAVIAHQKTAFLGAVPIEYKLNTVSAVGYSDDYSVATPSPLVRTVNEFGARNQTATNGAAGCVILSLRCGAQVQINGIGTSLRNRGYLAVGPVADIDVDAETHISGDLMAGMSTFAAKLDDPIVVLSPAVTLIPIRVHAKWLGKAPLRVLVFRTYSDVLGYQVNRVASYRRSRRPEA